MTLWFGYGGVHAARMRPSAAEFYEHLGCPFVVEDMLNILCSPISEDLPIDHLKRGLTLKEAKQTFRVF